MGINLMDEDGGKGNGLGVGWHQVAVRSFREFKANSGSLGIEYTLESGDGKIGASFYITPKAKYRLKLFATSCGLPEVKLRDFNFADIIGRTVRVKIEKNDKGYGEVTDWSPADFGDDDPLA